MTKIQPSRTNNARTAGANSPANYAARPSARLCSLGLGGGCFAGPPFFKSQIPPSAGLPFGLSAVWFFCASRLFAHFNRAMWHCIRRAVARLVGLFARLYFWTNFSTPLWWPAILYFRIIIHRIQLFQQEALVCLILGPLAHFRFYATAPAMWDQESSQIQHAFHRASCRRHTL